MGIQKRIKILQEQIHYAAKLSNRDPDSIKLIAVSKNQSTADIRIAYTAGIHDFGENYWQEFNQKKAQLSDLPITWHFLGPIQSNKAALIATYFHWIHSVDRIKIIKLLARHRPNTLRPLNICIQI